MNQIKKVIDTIVAKAELMQALIQLRDDLKNMGPVPEDKIFFEYVANFYQTIKTFDKNYSDKLKLFKHPHEHLRSLEKTCINQLLNVSMQDIVAEHNTALISNYRSCMIGELNTIIKKRRTDRIIIKLYERYKTK